MSSRAGQAWRIGAVYWRDGAAGTLAVAYVGFDQAEGSAIDCVTCSVLRLHRIADYAGVDRDIFVSDVVDEMTSLAEETAGEWELRMRDSGNSMWRFARGELACITAGIDDAIRDHLLLLARDADRTWNRIP